MMTAITGGLILTAFMAAIWYLLRPIPSAGEAKALAAISRTECECEDCMEPGLRGPSRTSLD